MTYKTPVGDRILVGAERKLFCAALGMIADLLSDLPMGYECGIPVFDDLQHNQKLASYLDIGQSLLDSNVPVPALTAVREATVASVYQFIDGMVASEIAEGNEAEAEPTADLDVDSWRTLLLAAARETLVLDELPDAHALDLEKWELIVQCLADRILWDNDWAMTEAMDVDVDQRVKLAEEMGIAPNYFVWVPPDPLDRELLAIIRQLQYLTPEGRGLPPA